MPQNSDPKARLGKRANLPDLLEAVAVEFGVTTKDIQGTSKCQTEAVPRHVLMWVARQEGYALKACGMIAGRKDHSTVTHALTRLRKLFKSDRALQDRCFKLLDRVREGEVDRVRTMRERTESWLKGGNCPLCGK